MKATLTELQARQTVRLLNQLRADILAFAGTARLLNVTAANFDSRLLLEEAGKLLQNLMKAQQQFRVAEGKSRTIKRALPARSASVAEMPLAAKWGNELRAQSKQFIKAAQTAERDIERLYQTAFAGINRPTRTATQPDGLLDALVNLADFLTRWIEHRKQISKT